MTVEPMLRVAEMMLPVGHIGLAFDPAAGDKIAGAALRLVAASGDQRL